MDLAGRRVHGRSRPMVTFLNVLAIAAGVVALGVLVVYFLSRWE